MGRAHNSSAPSAPSDSFESVLGVRRGARSVSTGEPADEPATINLLEAWGRAGRKRTQLDERMERLATPVERRAHQWFKTRPGFYKRAGQFPTLTSYENGVLRFHISNSRDPEDDFDTTVTTAIFGVAR